MLKKVISGGQTGVDRIGLEVAKIVGLKTGGTAAKGYLTETGADFTLKTEFGLKEAPESGYNYRTEMNVKDSDFTVIFGNLKSPGSILTLNLCKKLNKPYKENPTVGELVHELKQRNVKILNVAGNRASRLTDEQMVSITNQLVKTFQKLIPIKISANGGS
jgi:hypothetical protein